MHRLLSILFAGALLVTGCGSGEDLGGEPMAEDAAVVLPASAEAMGAVSSVRFELVREGARVYIDPLRSLSLSTIEGRFVAPDDADALLTVEVNDSLRTQLGAIAIGEQAWLSNPVTGDFEPLPESYGIDPSLFFDPQGGWQPLLEDLAEPAFVGVEQRDGTRYHLTGVAPSDRIRRVTAGLVRDQDVEVDLWVHPVSAVVTAVEFSTVFEGETSEWVLELSEYGAEFEILPPDQRED